MIAVFLYLLFAVVRADDKINYQQHIRPLFAEQRCLNCHNADKLRGGLDLSAYTTALNGGGGGPVLSPGDPDASALLGVVRHTREPKMPPGGAKIPDEAIELIRKWIAGGCLETADGKPAEKKPAANLAPVNVAAGAPGAAVLPFGLPLANVAVSERPGAVPALAAHPWSPVVALAGQKQTLLYHTQTLKLLGILPFDDGFPNVLRFSRGGQALLGGGGTGGKSGRVFLWSVANGERLAALGEEFDAVRAADVDLKLRWAALGGPSKVVKVFSLQTGQLLHRHEKHTDWITDLAYSPDGILLATADRNGGLHVWEAESHALLHSPAGHPAAITSLDWRADANLLATACEDGQIRLWEMNGGGLAKNWKAHDGGALCVRWAHDGRLVSAGRDRVVKLWDQNGALVRAFPPLNDIALACAFDHAGKRILATDLGGTVRVFNADDGSVIGELSPNPPPIPQQLEAARQRLAQLRQEKAKHEQELAAAQAAANTTAEQLKQTQQAAQAAEQAFTAAEAALPQAVNERNAAQPAREQAVEKLKTASAAATAARPEPETALAALKTAVDEDAKRQAEWTARETESAAALAQAEQAEKIAAAAPADAALADAAKTARANAEAAKQRLAEVQKAAAEASNRVKAAVTAAETAKTRRTETAAAEEAARTALTNAETALAAAQARYAAIDQQRNAAKAAIEQHKAQLEERNKNAAATAAQLTQATQTLDQTNRALALAEAEAKKWEAAALRVELDAVRATLAERETAFRPVTERVAAAQKAAEKANADFAAAKTRLETAPARIQELSAQVEPARQAVEKTKQEQAAKTQLAQTRAAALAAFQAAVEPLKAQAAAAPDNAVLAQAATKAGEALALLQQDAEAARQAGEQAARATQTAEEALKAAQERVAQAQAEQNALPARIEELHQLVQAAATQVATETAAAVEARKPVDEAARRVAELKQTYDQLLAAARPAYEN